MSLTYGSIVEDNRHRKRVRNVVAGPVLLVLCPPHLNNRSKSDTLIPMLMFNVLYTWICFSDFSAL